MQNKTILSFRPFTHEGRQNIILIALAVFYLTQFSLDAFVWKIMCGNLGGDYCAYWSAAKIANNDGYAEMYNLDKLRGIQRLISPTNLPFATRPVAYLPVFIVPFQILSFLGPFLGYWVWTIINLITFIFYMRYFAQNVTQRPLDTRLLIMALLSLPFFMNIFFGQVNIWLTICIGEHLRAVLADKPFKAGAWLGGLFIKPHYLVFIIIALAMQRYGKIIAGFMTSSAVIVGVSLLMSGIDGFKALVQLWLGYTGDLATADPFIMMNWRMVGVNLVTYLGPLISWMIAGIGMAITLVMTIYIWRHPILPASPAYAIALLGTLAATTALMWHSHIFSATILLAPIMFLSQERDLLPKKILSIWVIVPPIINFTVIVIALLLRGRGLAINPGGLFNLLNSGSQLGVNMYMLYWTTTKLRNPYALIQPE